MGAGISIQDMKTDLLKGRDFRAAQCDSHRCSTIPFANRLEVSQNVFNARSYVVGNGHCSNWRIRRAVTSAGTVTSRCHRVDGVPCPITNSADDGCSCASHRVDYQSQLQHTRCMSFPYESRFATCPLFRASRGATKDREILSRPAFVPPKERPGTSLDGDNY